MNLTGRYLRVICNHVLLLSSYVMLGMLIPYSANHLAMYVMLCKIIIDNSSLASGHKHPLHTMSGSYGRHML